MSVLFAIYYLQRTSFNETYSASFTIIIEIQGEN